MNRKIIPICGLPRSGSTLLCNILAQNPKFHTTPTSGCHDVLFGIKNNWSKLIEHKASKELGDIQNEKRVLSSVLNSYHNTDKQIIFDKGRGWTSMLEMLEFITDQKAKILVPVRDINEILASFENIYRSTIKHSQIEGDYFQQQTVNGRCKNLLLNSSVLGLAYDRLKDCMQRGFSDRLYIVEFDQLTVNPENEMKKIYNFLELEKFEHNFSNVKQITFEDDSIHGMDLHTIRPHVEKLNKKSYQLLGEDVCKQYKNTEFWRK